MKTQTGKSFPVRHFRLLLPRGDGLRDFTAPGFVLAQSLTVSSYLPYCTFMSVSSLTEILSVFPKCLLSCLIVFVSLSVYSLFNPFYRFVNDEFVFARFGGFLSFSVFIVLNLFHFEISFYFFFSLYSVLVILAGPD